MGTGDDASLEVTARGHCVWSQNIAGKCQVHKSSTARRGSERGEWHEWSALNDTL